MSLSSILEETVAASVKKCPAETLKVIATSSAELDAQGVGDNALKSGEKLPDATLTSATGEPIAINSLLNDGPLIISFYRGGWCPYCNLELKAYQDLLDDIHSLGGQLIAITPEIPDNSLSTVEKNELTFQVLTDQNSSFSEALGITFELPKALIETYKGFGLDLPLSNDDDRWVLPIPATFVVNKKGIIALSHVDRNYTKRLEPSEAVAALKETL